MLFSNEYINYVYDSIMFLEQFKKENISALDPMLIHTVFRLLNMCAGFSTIHVLSEWTTVGVKV